MNNNNSAGSRGDSLMTIKEVAAFLRYEDVKSVYDLIHTGELKATKLKSKVYRVRRSDLDQFLVDKEVKVPSI